MGLPWVLEAGLGEPAEPRGDLWSTWGAVSLKPPLGAWPKLGETFGDEGEAWERLSEQKTQLGLQGPTEGCPLAGCGGGEAGRTLTRHPGGRGGGWTQGPAAGLRTQGELRAF